MTRSLNPPRPKTILLVDDSEIACESVKNTLEPLGLKVITLNSPFGFINALREHRPGLVLVDVGLGSVNGTKLVELGRLHAPEGTAIVLYSSRDESALRADALSSGADGFISKRTTGDQLISAVRRWLVSGLRSSQP